MKRSSFTMTSAHTTQTSQKEPMLFLFNKTADRIRSVGARGGRARSRKLRARQRECRQAPVARDRSGRGDGSGGDRDSGCAVSLAGRRGEETDPNRVYQALRPGPSGGLGSGLLEDHGFLTAWGPLTYRRAGATLPPVGSSIPSPDRYWKQGCPGRTSLKRHGPARIRSAEPFTCPRGNSRIPGTCFPRDSRREARTIAPGQSGDPYIR